MSINIIKKNGQKEAFSREKLERSMKTIGVSDDITKNIISSIEEKEGLRSNDIRRMVTQQLEKVDKHSADKYNRQRRIILHQSKELKNGTILIDKPTLADLKITPGASIDVVVGSNLKPFITSQGTTTGPGAFLNINDIRSLNQNEGTRILIQRREE